jgi:hypothetical protein
MNLLQFRHFRPKFGFFLPYLPKSAISGSYSLLLLPKFGFFLFLFFFSLTAFAANYYVTQVGGGSHNGSSIGNSWSVTDFNGKTTPHGGDTVIFTGTFTSTIAPACNGSGNGAGRLILNFAGAVLNAADPRLHFSNRSYLTVIGGTLGPSYSGGLIEFNPNGGEQSHDITIEGWKYTGAANGVAVFVVLDHVYNLVVSNCTVDNVSMFVVGGSTLNHDIDITGCYARTSTDTTKQDDVIHISDVANVTIEKCKLINRAPSSSINHNDIIQTYTKNGSNPGNPTNWVIRYNWIEMQHSSGTGDASFLMMQSMAGNPALKLYANVFFGSATIGNNGVCVGRDNGGSYYCYNNTFVRHNDPDNTVRFNDSGTLYVKNNVGMSDPSVGVYQHFINWTMAIGAWDYNFWYLTYTSSRYAGPHGSVSLNPLFRNYAGEDFSLASNSPLLGKADRSIGAEYSFGIARGATWPNPALVSRTATTTSWDPGAY